MMGKVHFYQTLSLNHPSTDRRRGGRGAWPASRLVVVV